MSSSLFQNHLLDKIKLIKQVANGNPNAIFSQMLNQNPQFRQFVERNKGKSAEQILSENGIDLSILKDLLR